MTYKYYDHISRCTMAVFEDCLIHKNYRALIIGDHEIEDFVLEAAWMEIREQYVLAIGDQEQALYLKMLKEVNVLISMLEVANTLIEHLPFYFHPDWGRELNRIFQTAIPWNPNKPEEYRRQIDSVSRRIAGLEMKIDLKKIAIEQQQKKFEKRGGGEITHDYFATVYNLMEEVLECSIDPVTLTVQRYCERYRRMNKKYQKQKRH